MKVARLLRALALVAFAAPSVRAQGALIAPTAITSSTTASDFFPVVNLINGSGLSGTPTLADLGTHSLNDSTTLWVTTGAYPSDYFTVFPAPVLTCTLPSLLSVSELVIWGYGGNLNEGKTFNVTFSTDGTTYGNAATVIQATLVGTGAARLSFPGGPRLATHVKVEIVDNYYTPSTVGGDRVGLGELRFVVIPNAEPVLTNQAFAVDENSANGTVVGSVAATDPDAGQALTYAITAGNTGGAFALNPSTGQLTVATSSAFDFETTPSFALTVQVTDNGSPNLSASATVTVNLNNLTESPLIVIEQPAGTALEDGTSTADLGRVQLGFPETRTFTVRNTGAASLSLGAITVDGTDAAEFTADAAGMAATLAPGASTTFRVTFSPTARAQRSAVLHLASGDSARSPFDVALTAVGIIPGDPDSFDFKYGEESLDEPFVLSVAEQPDGKWVFGGRYLKPGYVSTNPQNAGNPWALLLRMNPDGELDPTVMIGSQVTQTWATAVETILVQPDGWLMFAGYVPAFYATDCANVTNRPKSLGKTAGLGAVDGNGSFENAPFQLGIDPMVSSFYGRASSNWIKAILPLPNKTVLYAGGFANWFSSDPLSGTVGHPLRDDLAYNPDAWGILFKSVPEPATPPYRYLFRDYETRFQMNPRVSGGGMSGSQLTPRVCMALQPDGKVLLSAAMTNAGTIGLERSTITLVRLNADGTLDAEFLANYVPVSTLQQINCLAVQPDGKILVVANNSTLFRLNSDGTRDNGFQVTALTVGFSVALQADGRIIVVGGGRVVRLNADGSYDPSFADQRFWSSVSGEFTANIAGITLLANGKVLAYGSSFDQVGEVAPMTRRFMVRLANDPATQTLSVPDTSQILWTRGGSSPEVTYVTLELSADGGATWSDLGLATRVGTTANWSLKGLTLPATGQIRARGRTFGGLSNAGNGLIESVQSFSAVPTPLQAWKLANLGDINASDLGDSDGDGLGILFEYAFGCNPNVSDASRMPRAQLSGDSLFYRFTEPVGVSGVTYGVEWSTTLESGSWTPIPDTGTPPQHNFSVPGTESRKFVRLKVTNP